MLSRSIGSQCLDMGLLAEPVLDGGKDLFLIAATARHQDLSREVSSPVCQWFPGGQGHLQEPAEGHRYLYRVEGVGHPLSADTEGTERGTGPLLVLVRVAGLVHLPQAALLPLSVAPPPPTAAATSAAAVGVAIAAVAATEGQGHHQLRARGVTGEPALPRRSLSFWMSTPVRRKSCRQQRPRSCTELGE